MNLSPNLWKQDGQDYHAELRENSASLNGYYEKLALLNGATVAPVVTAVLGPIMARLPTGIFFGCHKRSDSRASCVALPEPKGSPV